MPQVNTVVVARYIEKERLVTLLASLFAQGTYGVEIRLGRYIISTPSPLTKKQLDSCAPIGSNQ